MCLHHSLRVGWRRVQVGTIESEFRVFTMELLAGEPRTETEVVQHGQRFRLDFAQVSGELLRT